MKLLVVEDEATMARFLKRGLTEEGYAVDVVSDANEADKATVVFEYDLIILDVMIPGRNGFELCEAWRGRGLSTPILFVTARDGVSDKVAGLDVGGDDYLAKPFNFEELLARVRALLRRNLSAPRQNRISCGPIEIDIGTRRVSVDGGEVSLTTREFQLLEFLVRECGRVVSRTSLWEHVWESGLEPDSNVIDVYVRYLRTKLGPGYIETVRGAGYRLTGGGCQ